MTSILFVCLGNICRSPLAEGVFRHALDQTGRANQITIDSAGTGAWHVGSLPDPRSMDVALRHNIDISGQRARQVRLEDFGNFDYIFAMDQDNLSDLQAHAPSRSRAALRLFLTDPDTDVPDPYYGGDKGFETIYQMLKGGSEKLLKELIASDPS
ncbi:low molecular weight protein-tyrosine-phosphatase [Roseibium algae]|uniref:protein-tyrosine-phosphatase n=1 Tax=Roseibium algae TaxID=3123038 RepID=A0ABU8TR50_9HYPH